MSVYVVSENEAIIETVNDAVVDHFAHPNKLREVLSWRYTDIVEEKLRLRAAQGRDHMPNILLLDTNARAGSNPKHDRARTAEQLLETVLEEMPDLPIILATSSSETQINLGAMLRKQVWIWNTTADGTQDKRLATVLNAAHLQPKRRQFCATVRFERDAEYLDISENGNPHLTARPLLKRSRSSEDMRSVLHGYATKDLDELLSKTYHNMPLCWDELGKIGWDVFVCLFGDAHAALLQCDTSVEIEFRFEINKDVLADRFGLPLELLNRGNSGGKTSTDFLCRLLPMARRVGAVRPVLAPSTVRPHILFVDAGAAQGEREIGRQQHSTNFPALTATTEQQFQNLNAVAQEKHCSVERWDFAAFRRDYPGSAESTTLIEALRRRLEEPQPGHRIVDILHFSGHGVTPRGEDTCLVLPSAEDNVVELLPISRLAGWLPQSVRLVFLGACQSVSASTAEHLHRRKDNCSVVGFRWQIRADRIPNFVEHFYRAYLVKRQSIAAAYRAACDQSADDDHTLWASAVALTTD